MHKAETQMTEKKMVCDACEQEWEESFFCKQCSGLQGFDGEMVEEPNSFWDGNPGDEYVWEEREPEYMIICLNCCNHAA